VAIVRAGTTFDFPSGEAAAKGREVLVVPLCAKPAPALQLLAQVDEVCDDALSELVQVGALREELGQIAHSTRAGSYPRVVAVSLGEAGKLDSHRIRVAAARAAQWLIQERCPRVALWIDGLTASGVEDAVAQWAGGMLLGGFRFEAHRRDEKSLPARIHVRLCGGEPGHVRRVRPGVATETLVYGAVNYARFLAHQPANLITPATLAGEAQALGRQSRLRCQVLREAQLKRMKMNGLLAVGAGAKDGPCLIRLDYRGAPRARQEFVLVGKAITFDTGGYSIKPAAGLERLKFDKCGGVTVMAVLKAAAALRLKCNVVGLIAAAENSISERAYRPGDILAMMSGKTVEVISTDAEGRLVLADALWYAQKQCRPTALIDLATLTGGVIVALGRAAAGVMSNDDGLAGELGEAGRRTHERLWRLPLWDDYRDLIKGSDSDLKNSSNKREAHPIIGGMFLKEFVLDSTPWAHLDIAGVAESEDDKPPTGKGATGFGVRLLVDFLRRKAT